MLKKIFNAKLIAFVILLSLITIPTSSVNASGVRTILAPQNITDVTGRFFVEGQATPTDTTYMSVRWQDDTTHTGNAISISPTYDPFQFTGFTPPNPRASWQKGEYDDATNGSPVFQMNGAKGGIMMNSWFTTYQQISGGGQNTAYAHEFSNPTSPFTTSTSKLWVQGDLQVKWFANWNLDGNSFAPVGQVSYVMYFKDTTTNKKFCIVDNAYDNRSTTHPEYVSSDGYTYFASTHFGATRYSTPNAFSASWRSTTWNTDSFYRAEITRQNIANVATDINSTYSQNLSTNPSDYVLTVVLVLQETFRDSGDQVSLGSSFNNFSAYESY